MRMMALTLFSIAVSGGGLALAQGARAASGDDVARLEMPDEVIVRGRRLTELRADIQMARERAYGIFNDINSNDEFDIHCSDERKYHSRTTQRVCRARFETRISADAGQEYLSALRWSCRDPHGLHDCMFDGGGASAVAISAAQGVQSDAPRKSDLMNEEIQRLARENPRFAQAILDYYEASRQLETATRKRRVDD